MPTQTHLPSESASSRRFLCPVSLSAVLKSVCCAVMKAARGYLVRERGVGHEHPQVDINGCHQAALQLVFPELHSVHVVELQD